MGRATFYVEMARWMAFRMACVQRRISASKVLSEYITRQVEEWTQEEEAWAASHRVPTTREEAQGGLQP